jgi:hypothetical protein
VWSFSIALTYHVTRRSTVAIVFGPNEAEASAIVDHLTHSGLPMHWTTLPLMALECSGVNWTKTAKTRHSLIWQVENSVKMRLWLEEPTQVELEAVDLVGNTRALNSFFVELANFTQICQTTQSILVSLSEYIKLENLDEESLSSKTIDLKIRYLKSLFSGLQARCDYLMRRAEAQLQTVSEHHFGRTI